MSYRPFTPAHASALRVLMAAGTDDQFNLELVARELASNPTLLTDVLDFIGALAFGRIAAITNDDDKTLVILAETTASVLDHLNT